MKKLKQLRNCALLHYFCVIIILLNTGLYNFAISIYFFGKLHFPLSVFSIAPGPFCLLNKRFRDSVPMCKFHAFG